MIKVVRSSRQFMKLIRSVSCLSTGRLVFKGMQFPVEQGHRLGVVFVMMRESEVSLREVETKDHQCKRANQVLLVGVFNQLGSLHGT